MKGRARGVLVITAVVAVVASTVGVGMALAGGGRTPSGPIGGGGAVVIRGRESFEPNALIQATFRFSPDKAVVNSGQSLRWVDRDESEDPHTITIVQRDQLPRSAGEVFNCKVCNQAIKSHFAGGKLQRKVDPDGDGGLDQPGDSLLIFGGDISRQVTARSGSKLYYLCAIHPWMQGRIVVG
jgi:plastocyanin